MSSILVKYTVDSMHSDVDVTLRFDNFIQYTRFASFVESCNKNVARYLEVSDLIHMLEAQGVKGDVMEKLKKRRDQLNKVMKASRESLNKIVNERIEDVYDSIGDGEGIDSISSYESNRVSDCFMSLEVEQGLKVTWFADGSSNKNERNKPIALFDEDKREEFMGEEYATFVKGKKEVLKGLRDIFEITNNLEKHVRTIGK